MAKISKQTSRLYNRALLLLITGFVFVSMFVKDDMSWGVLLIAIPAFISGIYYLSLAYSQSKKEL